MDDGRSGVEPRPHGTFRRPDRAVKDDARRSESGERLRAILDTAVDAIVTIDASGDIESINPAAERTFGYTHDELVGRNVSVLMPSPWREAHDHYLARYLRTGEARIVGIGREVEAQRKDGTIFPADLAVSEVRLPDRWLFTGIIRDLTERRAMEKQARLRLEDSAHTARLLELGEMCSGLAHEMSQPLTAILSFAETSLRMIRAGGDPALIEDALGQIVEQGEHTAEILSRLGDLVRKHDGRLETFGIGTVIEDALLLVDHERRQRGVRVTVHCDPELPAVTADRVQIEQILLNLLRNAFHAVEGAERRQVWMRVRCERVGRVRLVVEDSGPGLTPELCDRVFDTFYSTKPNGLGVGLAISRSLAERHGGHLWAESVAGRGARFGLELPLATPER